MADKAWICNTAIGGGGQGNFNLSGNCAVLHRCCFNPKSFNTLHVAFVESFAMLGLVGCTCADLTQETEAGEADATEAVKAVAVGE